MGKRTLTDVNTEYSDALRAHNAEKDPAEKGRLKSRLASLEAERNKMLREAAKE